MPKSINVLLLLLAICGSSVSRGEDHRQYHEMAVVRTSKNFQIPKVLRERIEKNYIKYYKGKNPTTIDSDEKILDKVPRDFLEVDVYFTQEAKGTLQRDFVMRSPRGGGLVDLSGQVIGKKGSFYVKFDLKPPGEVKDKELHGLQAYYISSVQRRKIADEWYGTECGTLVDITASVVKSQKDKGLRVNATDDRYFNTLVGDYFFVSYGPEKIYLAAIMLDDSSITSTRCAVKEAP